MKGKFPPPAPRELVLIVDPKAGIRVKNGEVVSIEPGGDAPARELAERISAEQVIIRPLYGVSEDWLQHRTSDFKETMMGVGQRLDLSIFYKITSPDERLERLESLVKNFREIRVVQAAYIKPGAELTIMDNSIEHRDGLSPDPTTGDLTAAQVYLNAVSEGGIGVPCAWATEGGRGEGVTIIDAEGAWRFSHEDLLENPDILIGGTEMSDMGWRNHGTAVFGVIGGNRNGFGVSGICPEATLKAVSLFGSSNGGSALNWSAAAAIVRAADELHRGDIILIEQHLPGPRANFNTREDQVGYIPIEWWPCNFAAIQYATSQGIIVIEAAGNGQQHLDNCIYDDNPAPPNGPFPAWWHNPFRRNPIDSGAILVGAGIPPQLVYGGSSEQDRSRSQVSNYGSMVDAQGWGDDVVTCGYGGFASNDPDEDRWYTSRFNGTSSAAAMVTGAVGCLQGVSRARGNILSPARVRELLRDNLLNSPQTNGDFGVASVVRIGPRPNLCRLIDHTRPPTGLKDRIPSFLKAIIRKLRGI